MKDEDDKAEELFRAVLANSQPFVSDELADRLAECAERHALDYGELYKWAERISIGQGLLENVEDGTLDVVGRNDNGEWLFKSGLGGLAKAASLLMQSPEGRELVALGKEKQARDEAILGADEISDDTEQP